MYFPHNVSDQSISLFIAGSMRSIPASDPNFTELSEHLALAEHSYEFVEGLIDKPKMIARLSEGVVDVIGSTVYYKGVAAHSTMAYRLLEVLNAGQQATMWARFFERVMANPSQRSRECLYEFLNKFNAPLTEDGHFITFKRVRHDYMDMHSNTMDNSPGSIVQMERSHVNEDPDVTCSYGLHVAATSYLGEYANVSGSRTLACKVDPADVVAVPRDYNSAKMRVCRYLVIGDATEAEYTEAETTTIFARGVDGGEPVLADTADRAICTNAHAFSVNWKRVEATDFAAGNTVVVDSSYTGDSEVPDNLYMVGTIIEVENLDDETMEILSLLNGDEWDSDATQIASVEWQDGTISEYLAIYPYSSAQTQITAVEFIGEHIVKEEEPEYEDFEECDYEEEGFYCGECGSIEVDDEDEVCWDCAEADELRWQEENDATADAMDEADHIALEGLTVAGTIPTQHELDNAAQYADIYAHGHNVARFTHEPDDADEDDKTSELAFTRDGVTYTATDIMANIKLLGQRGYSRSSGVPRTTLQVWATKIEACED